MGLREEVIKELASEYKRTRDPIVLEKIILRTEKLLLKTIHRTVVAKPHLEKVSLQDLYHTSITGLTRALQTSTGMEDGKEIIFRICSYVKLEISNIYKPDGAEEFFYLPPLGDSEGDSWERIASSKTQTTEDIINEIQLRDLLEEYKKILIHNIISKKEWELITKHICYGVSYNELGEELGTSGEIVRRQTNRALKKVKRWFMGYEI